MRRRDTFRLLSWAAASPLLAAEDLGVMGPVNAHEFEEIAKTKLHKLAYDFIAGGVEDEKTLRANREAFERVFLVPRVMRDVSEVDTSVELLGHRMPSPIAIAPTGGKNLVLANADEIVARASVKAKTVFISGGGAESLLESGEPVVWWANTIGSRTKPLAQAYARRVADRGGRAIVLTVDNQYQSNRDRNNRNRFDYGYMQTGPPKPGEAPPPPRNPARAAMWQPHTPGMTWEQIEWLKSASKLPVMVKGILSPEDAVKAVESGADAISVSNHGGRQLDGVIASLDALPDVADAVQGRVPVVMDGGIRRGSDVVKALALGAKAVLVGRAPLWGLGAFGQPGVERVLELLQAEFQLSLALSGCARCGDLNRRMVRRQYRFE